MTTAKILFFLPLLLFFAQHLPGQTERKSITSWVPSREEIGFESTAHLPRGAEVRILVVKTGHSSAEVVIYPVSPQYPSGPDAQWSSVKNGQVLVFQISIHGGSRFSIHVSGTGPYFLQPGSCTRQDDYDQLTFAEGCVLNVKVLHEF
jgi:hypothetical protein